MITTENSVVVLRGVDQSILLLNEDADITQKRLDQEIGIKRKDLTSSYAIWPSFGLEKLFQDLGLIILINRNVKRWEAPSGSDKQVDYLEYDDYDERFEIFGPKSGVRGMHSRARNGAVAKGIGSATNSGGSQNTRALSNFPETWNWEELCMNESATATISKILPDCLTSWVITITAFSHTKSPPFVKFQNFGKIYFSSPISHIFSLINEQK